MKALRILALAGLALPGGAAPSLASIQGQMYCWAYDLEFPVPCDAPEEEEDEAASIPRTEMPPARPNWPALPAPGRRAPAGA